jgi:hypothetical protein
MGGNRKRKEGKEGRTEGGRDAGRYEDLIDIQSSFSLIYEHYLQEAALLESHFNRYLSIHK